MTRLNVKNSTTQRTLKQPITYVGIGLHTGKKVSMIVRPATEGQGIHFHRKDVPAGTGFIPARWYNIVETRMSTVLGNEHGITISTVEHLLAALRGCGVDLPARSWVLDQATTMLSAPPGFGFPL